MRILTIGVASACLLACGGSVSKDGLNGGSSGSSGSGGIVSTGGTGAIAGTGAVAGSGGSSGTGAVAGNGGAGGGQFCCQSDAECNPETDFWTNECVEGLCLPIPSEETCWTQKDCYKGECIGACVCPCGYECDCGGQLGKCIEPLPPPEPGCCQEDWDCGDIVYVPCVNGVCKQHVPSKCWNDAECGFDGKCVGAFVCPCAADCAAEDKPGTCQ